MVFELNNIFKDYMQGKEPVPVLKDISLSVDDGEYVAIMGPSGSGKSTLMNIIGCLDKQTKGSFIFDGSDIMKCSDKQLSDIRNTKIGFVFQNFNLLPRQSALENVELPLLYAGLSRKKRRELAKEALRKVGLEDRMNFNPTQLSGGQKQRVAIARAIVNKPKLLLADEPTGALDTKSGDDVMELFEELNKDGVTIVMITHEPEIADHAKRVMYIRDGELHSGAFNSRAKKEEVLQAVLFGRHISQHGDGIAITVVFQQEPCHREESMLHVGLRKQRIGKEDDTAVVSKRTDELIA